ncbi:telomere-protecting terminal protein Tpg [Streptomyces sp. NPDC088553]|uniref:telomere-protecting terminal protein Tpg n=1 Tax=Streptomyces sp. NPDC088553 TaxID=3365864 RepID=UPI003821901B
MCHRRAAGWPCVVLHAHVHSRAHDARLIDCSGEGSDMTVDAALRGVLAGAFTRLSPKSAGAQVRHLVKQHHGSARDVAALLGVSQRTVERYVRDQIEQPRAELADRMAAEVRRRWQPQVRARARKAAVTSARPDGGRPCPVRVHRSAGYHRRRVYAPPRPRSSARAGRRPASSTRRPAARRPPSRKYTSPGASAVAC